MCAWAGMNIIRYQVPLWHWTIIVQPIFHLLGKTYCWVLLNPHPQPPPLPLSFSHITKCPFFLLSPGHIQWKNSHWTWERLTYPRGLPSTAKNENKTQHQYFSHVLLIVWIPAARKPNSGRPLNMHTFKQTHTQMEAHNMHLYELLRHVYLGSMAHRDLEGLSKGTRLIVTFSWDRPAQIEEEWQVRVQKKMCLMQRERALGMHASAGLAVLAQVHYWTLY